MEDRMTECPEDERGGGGDLEKRDRRLCSKREATHTSLKCTGMLNPEEHMLYLVTLVGNSCNYSSGVRALQKGGLKLAGTSWKAETMFRQWLLLEEINSRNPVIYGTCRPM